MGKVRGIRFADQEEALIEEFLRKNPLLDFSTFAKIAILAFIKQPLFTLIPVRKASRKEIKRDVRSIP